MFRTTVTILGVIGGSFCFGQTYRCDWSVNGIGGGEMSSSAYKCGATAGQTAAGFVTASNYWALIGYWLPEGQTGVREQAYWPSQGPLVTRLYGAMPNPAMGFAAIRYALAVQCRVRLQLHDLTGRVVRTLADGVQKPGRYALRWNGSDAMDRTLANGVYFIRLNAGDYTGTEKLVLQR
jgi:hypothetical protein